MVDTKNLDGIQNWITFVGRLAVAPIQNFPYSKRVPQCGGGVLVVAEFKPDDTIPRYFNNIKPNIEAAERELDVLRETIKGVIAKKASSSSYQMS